MKWLARALGFGRPGCPPGWKLTRAVSEGAGDPAIDAHVRVCARCWAEAESLADVVLHARDLPPPEPMPGASRQAISVQLLNMRARPALRRRLGPGLILGGVAAAAVAVTLVVARRPPAPSVVALEPVVPESGAVAPAPARVLSRASIRAIGSARYARVQPAPDDVIRLDEGSIVLEVAPLPSGERFRVRTSDAEVEVRGTRFRVSADNGTLLAVLVTEGRVEVRSPGGGHVLLEPGDEWVRGAPGGGSVATAKVAALPTAAGAPATAAAAPGTAAGAPAASAAAPGTAAGAPATSAAAQATAAAAPATTSAAVPSADPVLRARVAPPPTIDAAVDPRPKPRPPAPAPRASVSEARASFDRAWTALRQGDARQAAELFAEIERMAQGKGIAEDALYWRAVATARAGDPHTAEQLLGEFLIRFPASSRSGEANTALGWLLLEGGNTLGARAAFERAAHDPSPTVRSSALDGLRRATPAR